MDGPISANEKDEFPPSAGNGLLKVDTPDLEIKTKATPSPHFEEYNNIMHQYQKYLTS